MQHYQTRDEIITITNNAYLIRPLKDQQQFYDHEYVAEALGISSATCAVRCSVALIKDTGPGKKVYDDAKRRPPARQ